MKYKPVRDRCCQNEKCQDHGKFDRGNIIRHSMYKTRQGRRRRYLCKTHIASRSLFFFIDNLRLAGEQIVKKLLRVCKKFVKYPPLSLVSGKPMSNH
jgi:hypothetical protein